MFKNNLNQIYACLLLAPALILMGTFTHIPSIKTLMNSKLSLTPHIGAATNEAQERIGLELADQIISLINN